MGFLVPVRRAFFKDRSVLQSPKWVNAWTLHRIEPVLVPQFGSKNKELVDKALACDAILFGVARGHHVAIVSRDKGFASTFALLREEGAPQSFAFTDVDQNRDVFESHGAICIRDRLLDCPQDDTLIVKEAPAIFRTDENGKSEPKKRRNRDKRLSPLQNLERELELYLSKKTSIPSKKSLKEK